jgi:hypothetical protein
MKRFRAVSNVDSQGFAPALNRRFNDGHAAVGYYDSLEEAKDFLRFAGGMVYLNADDSVAAVVQPLSAGAMEATND